MVVKLAQCLFRLALKVHRDLMATTDKRAIWLSKANILVEVIFVTTKCLAVCAL